MSSTSRGCCGGKLQQQAANSNYEAPAPANVKALANQVLDAIAAIPF